MKRSAYCYGCGQCAVSAYHAKGEMVCSNCDLLTEPGLEYRRAERLVIALLSTPFSKTARA